MSYFAQRPGLLEAVDVCVNAPPTPFVDIWGSLLQLEYDPHFNAITTKGGAVSSFASGGAGPLTLAQASGPAQPTHTNTPPHSFLTADGTGDSLLSAAGTDLTGGDICIVAIVKKHATPAGTGCIFGLGPPLRSQLRIQSTGAGLLDGVIRDATGSDIITSAVSETTLFHTMVLYNDVGVRRCLWTDGGTGVAGARTTALSTAHTTVAMFSDFVGTSLSNISLAYAAVLKDVPTLAQINTWANACQQRFRPLGMAAWTTAT